MDGASVEASPNTSAASVKIYDELARKLNKVKNVERVSQVTHSYSLRWEEYKVTHYAELYYTYADGAISVKHMKSDERQIVNIKIWAMNAESRYVALVVEKRAGLWILCIWKLEPFVEDATPD